jgi:Stigma-specific protein, Stig1
MEYSFQACFRKNVSLALLFLILLVFVCTGGACAATLSAPVTINPNLIAIPVTTLTTAQPQTTTCTAPCECMLASDAVSRWGEGGYTQCSNTPCGQVQAVPAGIAYVPAYKYCFQAKPVRVLTATVPVTKTIAPRETVSIAKRRACGAGLTLCGLLDCVNTSTDRYNCGSCGNACPTGEICRNGQCTVRTVQKRTCSAGLTLCNLVTCVNTSSDTKNCGSCGHVCPNTQVCTDGQCRVPVKALVTQDPCLYQGKTNCWGTCIDTAGSDNNNCGGCGWVCPGGLTCDHGECVMECPDGQIDCQYNCYDPMTDPDNCGTCGNSCGQGQTCCSGTCTDTGTDPKNCGHCGWACNAGDYCDGQCEHSVACPAGQSDCQYNCYDLTTDPNNCGKCGNSCTFPETCINGACQTACGIRNSQTNAIATCADGVQDQDETGVDCGGSRCSPCNTLCTTGTKYAPLDTPCTSVYNYHSTIPSVPGSDYMPDMYYVYAHYDACPFCNYPCQSYELCHPALDPMITEAEKCCSLTSIHDIETQMPEPDICKYAVTMSQTSCRKCTGIYLIKELADGTRWMDGYQDETETDKAKQITNAGGSPPYGTANYLLNYYHTGICHDYALAVTTLLRKAGYPQWDVGSYCDGAHCYNVVRFPGDAKWHVVDTDMPNQGGETWEYGKLQNGYPYCHTMDENSIFYNMGSYFTGPIPDIYYYYAVVNNGQTYQYQQKQPFQPKCDDPYTPLPCSIQYGGPPLTGPGVGGIGKDYRSLPNIGVRVEDLVGC